MLSNKNVLSSVDELVSSKPYQDGIKKSYYYDDSHDDGNTDHHLSKVPPLSTGLKRKACIVTGNSTPHLGYLVAQLLNMPVHPLKVDRTAAGEIHVRPKEPVVGRDVYVVHSTCGNDDLDTNEALMELLLIVRRMKLSQAEQVTAVVPYFGYSRQDHKSGLRVPIGASAVAGMISTMGADHVVTVDLHSGQIQGFFDNVPVDDIPMSREFAQQIKSYNWFDPTTCVVVSPDASGVERARSLADLLGVKRIVNVVKRHIEGGSVDILQTIGEVRGFSCVIVDDMIDSALTLVKACDLLREHGATRVIACITHSILPGNSIDRVSNCKALDEVVVSDSIPQTLNVKRCSKLRVLPVAPVLATTIAQLIRESNLRTASSEDTPVKERVSSPPSASPGGTPPIVEQVVE